jgi:WD40 repeat protein
MNDPKKLASLYQPKQGKPVNLDRQVCTLRFSPCGKFLAAGGSDTTVRRLDATTDALAALPPLIGHNGWVQALAFHPDGKRLLTADSWGELRCWPFADREPKPLWVVKQAHDGWLRGVAVSPDGSSIATCGRDGKVCLWSAADGKKLRECIGHKEDVFSVAFHPDGKSLVSGDLKGVVKQWDVVTGKPTREFDGRVLHTLSRLQDVGGARCLVFDTKGTTLACAGTKPVNGGNVQGTPTVLLFDWATGKLKHTLNVGGNGDGFVYDLAFHPTGFVIGVTSGNPGTGKFFFMQPGDSKPFFLTPKMANCHALAVDPSWTRLVVAATNTGSNGNGRNLNKKKEYPGNYSPLFVWRFPKA